MKIAIFGVGGVGGYLAVQATHYYKDNEDIQFYLIARGKHLEAIQKNGITLRRDNAPELNSRAFIATDDIAQCGKLDYIIYTTKSYSIDENIDALRAASDENTTIITFLNGVEGAEKLRAALPQSTVCEGCVYVYSKILEPGVISETGSLANYMIGNKAFYDLMSPAVDKFTLSDDIRTTIWGKFSYISPFATITTWYNITSDMIGESEEYTKIFKGLCDEFEAVGKAYGIKFRWNIYERNSALRAKSPKGSTSSMQRDYHSAKPSEVDTLTRYISSLGAKLGIATHYYDLSSEEL